MESPTMFGARQVALDTYQLSAFLPVADLGVLPVNAFVIDAAEPLLVDTGLGMLRDAFVAALGRIIDPQRLRWIWLSHMDADHIGNLKTILEIAPRAQIVTNFLGMGKMNLAGLPVDRVHLLEPGRGFGLGDRELVPLRPVYYDAPETIGFFDSRSRALFAADAFGALMAEPVTDAREIGDGALRDGLIAWSSIDAPWLGSVDKAQLVRSVAAIERLVPSVILSSHLPHAVGLTSRLVQHVLDASAAGVDDDSLAIAGPTVQELIARFPEGAERVAA